MRSEELRVKMLETPSSFKVLETLWRRVLASSRGKNGLRGHFENSRAKIKEGV